LLQEAGWFLLVGVVLLVVGLRYALRTERGCFVRDYLLLRIPIVGKLQIKAAMSRFSSVFALLQASGVLALDAITILSDTIGNAAIARDFDNIREMLRSGQGLSNPLRTSRYFPPMVVNMVAIGEESGKLDEMLSEISKHYDAEVEYAMKKLSDSFGPILTVLLAIVVGFFALAIYMPMWKLGQMLH
jgi:type IV pilus assembly protein PilC